MRRHYGAAFGVGARSGGWSLAHTWRPEGGGVPEQQQRHVLCHPRGVVGGAGMFAREMPTRRGAAAEEWTRYYLLSQGADINR
jgi:hypothetical protein